MKRALLCAAGFFLLATLGAGIARADCPDKKILCVKPVNGKIFNNGVADAKGRLPNEGMCWKNWSCHDCNGDSWPIYAGKCNAQYSACAGVCAACPLYQDRDAITQDPCYDKNGTKYDTTSR